MDPFHPKKVLYSGKRSFNLNEMFFTIKSLSFKNCLLKGSLWNQKLLFYGIAAIPSFVAFILKVKALHQHIALFVNIL